MTITNLASRPIVTVSTISVHIFENESFELRFWPPEKNYYELEIKGHGFKKVLQLKNNLYSFKDKLTNGKYFARVRYSRSTLNSDEELSEWSLPLFFFIYAKEDKEQVWQLRKEFHQLSMITEYSNIGTCMPVAPEILPPAYDVNNTKWFPTACYEGCSMLVNMDSYYYRDPLNYFLESIDALRNKGALFRTWDDLIDNPAAKGELEIIIQLDIDGGVNSLRRLLPHLFKRGVTGTIMTHRRARCWYDFNIENYDINLLQSAESKGWAIGYHNNTLTYLMEDSQDESLIYSETTLSEACKLFEEDVKILRQFFTIRTFTHHGGNLFNNRVKPLESINITAVDKPLNPELWSNIRSMFSDGAFTARPTNLKSHIDNLNTGRHFLRIHPFKYANYSKPFDAPSLQKNKQKNKDLSIEINTSDELVSSELHKQQRWWNQRILLRGATRLSYASQNKPISSNFSDYKKIQGLVEDFRKSRRESFLKQYPWAPGDPRVFWWRMLSSFIPNSSRILNIGALPPGQKHELTSFLPPNSQLTDVDIDPERKPDLLADITKPPAELYGEFDVVLLYGLPYVSSPGVAVDNCYKLLKPNGLALFGFAADTHPFRGGCWQPQTRPTWTRAKEPLSNIGLKGKLWSFNEEELVCLFRDWSQWKCEFIMHYWFAVGEKKNE
jgi:SAM-dependent methyltransferase